MLTMEETAELLKVHYNTVRNWVKKGRLKHFKLDGIVRIPREEIMSKITKEKEC